MPLFTKPLGELTRADILAVTAEHAAEDSTTEFKRDVELEPSGRMRDRARNRIAREVVAFANTDGGTLLVGIDETDDHPKRAATPYPLDNCHELADRLRRAIYEVIEPKLPILNVGAVDMDEDGRGVVVVEVPRSYRAPHRLEPEKECYRRVNDESRTMSMREIQELTLSAASDAARIESRVDTLKSSFFSFSHGWFVQSRREPTSAGMRLHMAGVPLSPISLRILRNPAVAPVADPIRYKQRDDEDYEEDRTWADYARQATPILRGEQRLVDINSRLLLREKLFDDGSLSLGMAYRFVANEDPQRRTMRIYSGWILSHLATTLKTIDKVRRTAGAPNIEYALDVALKTDGQGLLVYARRHYMPETASEIPSGGIDLPRYSVNGRAEFWATGNLVMRDILNATGVAADIDWHLDFGLA